MQITNFNAVVLEKATRLTDGKNPYTEVYSLHNGKIFKLLKEVPNTSWRATVEYSSFYRYFCRKLKAVPSFSGIPFLVLPNEVALDAKGKVKGYFVNEIEMISISQCVNPETEYEDVTEYFLKLAEEVAILHEHGIIVPDLFNETNLSYEKERKRISFIDYDGMQIKRIPSNAISSNLCYRKNPILRTEKYLGENGLRTENIDTFSLLVGFFHQITGVNMANLPLFQTLCQEELTEEEAKERVAPFFEKFGLSEEDMIGPYLHLFMETEKEEEPKQLIKKFQERYTYNREKEMFQKK